MHVLYVIDSLDRPGGAEQALAAMAPTAGQRGRTTGCRLPAERPGLQDDLRDSGADVFPVIEDDRGGASVRWQP